MCAVHCYAEIQYPLLQHVLDKNKYYFSNKPRIKQIKYLNFLLVLHSYCAFPCSSQLTCFIFIYCDISSPIITSPNERYGSLQELAIRIGSSVICNFPIYFNSNSTLYNASLKMSSAYILNNKGESMQPCQTLSRISI